MTDTHKTTGVRLEDLQVGEKVHYQPEYYEPNEFENGIVKKICDSNDSGVWVVYNCAGNWDRYAEYTGALTPLCNLHFGWLGKDAK